MLVVSEAGGSAKRESTCILSLRMVYSGVPPYAERGLAARLVGRKQRTDGARLVCFSAHRNQEMPAGLAAIDTMKTSARNCFAGVASRIVTGAVNDEVVITANGVDIAAIITNDSATRLDLKVGGTASAAVKASSVIVAVD